MPGVVQGVSGSVPGRVRDFLRSCVFQEMLSVVQGVSGRVFDSVFGSVYRFSGSFMEHLGCFQTFEIVFSTLFTDHLQLRNHCLRHFETVSETILFPPSIKRVHGLRA